MAGAGPEVTLRTLLRSPHPQATRLLFVALDNGGPVFRRGAARALAMRADPAGRRALVRRHDELDPEARDALVDLPPRCPLDDSLIEALDSGEPALAAAAATIATRREAFVALPALVRAAQRPDLDRATILPHATGLAERLAERVADYARASPEERPAEDPTFDRRAAMNALIAALQSFETHGVDELIDLALLLAPSGDLGLLELLKDPSAPVHAQLRASLQTSLRPGAFELLAGLLTDPATPRDLTQLAATRADAFGLGELLYRIGTPIGARARQSLERVEHIAWLEPDRVELLAELTGEEQAVAVELASAASVPPARLQAAIELVLDEGEPAGQLAAARAIRRLPPTSSVGALGKAVRSAEPGVIAAVAPLLRPRGYPEATPTLVGWLDHESVEVRLAVQTALRELTFSTFRDIADTLAPRVRRRLGRMVAKADPLGPATLEAELHSGAVGRRMAALDHVDTMGLADALVDALTELVGDPDAGVRAEAIRVIGTADPTPAAFEAVAAARADGSGAVRRAAEAVFAAMAVDVPLDEEEYLW